MLKVFVDSGSSIKESEKSKYNIEIIPLKILFGQKEYLDGIDLSIEEFYNELLNNKNFPKTSLPKLDTVYDKVTNYTDNGDDVIILTLSQKISGTYNAFKMLFNENDKVRVIDSKVAVGGMRLIVDKINEIRDKSLDEIEKIVNKFILRIKILAIPETLHYLFKGGRLKASEWAFGTILRIKPIIGFEDGCVKVLNKKIGLKSGMQYIADSLKEFCVDLNYDIIASYTYKKENLERLISITDNKYLKNIRVFDDLDPVIAAHWGPNAFGYIFVSKE